MYRSNSDVRYFCWLTILLVLGFTEVCWADTQEKSVPTLGIDAAVSKAVRDNPSLSEMKARYEALSEVPPQVSSLPDPVINLGAANFPVDTFDRAQEAMTQLQIGVSQGIPFPGKLSLKHSAAKHDAKAAAHSVAEARLQLIRKVRIQWWQLYFVSRALETVDRNQLLLRQFIKVAKTKYETGKGLQQDVLLAQLELSKLIDQRLELVAAQQQQAINLNVLMDQSPEKVIILPKEVDRSLPIIAADNSLYASAESMRPLLRELETRIDAAQSRLDLAKRGYYPDLTLGLQYGERTGTNPIGAGARSDFLSIRMGVKVPLYALRKQSRAVRQRDHELHAQRYALMDERGLVRGAIAATAISYNRSKKQLTLFETGIVPQAEQTVQSMLAAYQVNKVDFLNLVRSQMTLFNYELQYWKALSEAKQALAQLQSIVGTEAIYE